MSDTASGIDRPRGGKGREAFRTISEVADELDLPQHVLRFWESKFSQIKPLKRGGNRRYYRPDDVTLLRAIKKLLHADGYTIRGVQKLFKAQGLRATVNEALDLEYSEDVKVELPSSNNEPEAKSSNFDNADDAPTNPRDQLSDVLADLKRLRKRLS